MSAKKLIRLGRPSFGTWACTRKHKDDFGHCSDRAEFCTPEPEGRTRKQFCLAHALEYCYKNGIEFPFPKKAKGGD